MGMYTEVVVKIRFNKNKLEKRYIDILGYMFNPDTVMEIGDLDLPEHPFFKCDRWDSIGNMSSFYHHPSRVSDWYIPVFSPDDVYIFARNDLKNYDGEIDKFFDWVVSLNLDSADGEFIGYSLYEEDSIPKIYNMKEK